MRIRWSHRNHRNAIRHRRSVLSRLATVDALDPTIFPDPATDAVLAKYQEAYVGQMTIPVGVVGPLAVSLGQYTLDEPDGAVREVGRSTESVFLPLGHTEGGLSASMLRGLTAANEAGGVQVRLLKDQMTRDSAYQFDDMQHALAFRDWILAEEANLKAWVRDPGNPGYQSKTPGKKPLLSRHAHLWRIEPRLVGPVCHLLYRFSTGDACGPNMMTRNAYALNTEIVNRWAQIGPAPRRLFLEANLGGDKKPSWAYVDGGHGKTVMAWVDFPDEVLRHRLHIDPEAIGELEWVGLHGAHHSGMQSFAFTPASAVAALFTVTGQDLGMVGTSSMAQASVWRHAGRTSLAIQFSGLEVGTVGGGTSLPHAETYLRLMGCNQPGGAQRLAQIVAAAALCLEISAAASMASHASENFMRTHLERGGLRSE